MDPEQEAQEPQELSVEQHMAALRGEEVKPEPQGSEEAVNEGDSATPETGEDADAEDQEGEELEVSEEGDESDEQEPEKPRKRRKADPQKRIRKLVAERNQEREIRAKLEAQNDLLLKQLEQRQQPTQEPTEPQGGTQEAGEDPEPKQSDYEDYAQFLQDHGAWNARAETRRILGQAAEQKRQQTAQAQKQEAQKSAEESAVSLFEAGREVYDDFDEVAGGDFEVTEPMFVSIISAKDAEGNPIGHELQYHLGKHPEEAARISKLNPFQQAREMTLLEAAIVGRRSTAPKKKTTNAPAPIKPVQGKGAPTTLNEDTMDIGQYMKMYNRRELPSQK